jgi:hypothetical protein
MNLIRRLIGDSSLLTVESIYVLKTTPVAAVSLHS